MVKKIRKRYVVVALSEGKKSHLQYNLSLTRYLLKVIQGTHTFVISSPKGLSLPILSIPTRFPPSLPLCFFLQWMKQNMVSHYQPDSSLSLTGGVTPPSLLCGELGSVR